MKTIGLLSDTHSHWDNKYEEYFSPCDEIWHAGDIGNMELAERFNNLKKFRAVHGNIDDYQTRLIYPKDLVFDIEGVKVLMTHIGGYPGKYDMGIKSKIQKVKPQLFISGHSHILKVMYDQKLHCLHINPGSAGIYGMHQVRTLVRFVIDKQNIRDLEVIELNR